MSTFDGIVEEFPDIRIDYFRYHPGRSPPAACFLSHVHSDHLLGLDTLKMPFVYCSAVTKRLLLRMEKYPHRINFSKGILEARKQTYKHLKQILRPLPLNTPVEIELGPKSKVHVTLFDANHCPGAVMFLIEGNNKAILYTGDIRAEPWWVNALVRNPVLIPFTSCMKKLDCIYLDTTFASHDDIHREFPTKAEGLQELIEKVARCSRDSVFYFRAWTLGYEDVWIVLSMMLKKQVHVDQYQMRLFRGSTEDSVNSEPGPCLTGFTVGNSEQPGCLTTEHATSIHSCEPGLPCHTALKRSKNTVWITPIISRLRDGTEVLEVGAGGGKGDLFQRREVEINDGAAVEQLQLLSRSLGLNPENTTKLGLALTRALSHQDHKLVLNGLETDHESELTIKDFLDLLIKDGDSEQMTRTQPIQTQHVIHFPYSRHSSYSELRHLIGAFRPKEICPCTVDLQTWDEKHFSMESLFGDLVSEKIYRYDKIIKEETERRRNESSLTVDEDESQIQMETQRMASEDESTQSQDRPFTAAENLDRPVLTTASPELNRTPGPALQPAAVTAEVVQLDRVRLREAWHAANDGSDYYYPPSQSGLDTEMLEVTSEESDSELGMRSEAFEAAKRCLETGDATEWMDLRLRSLGWLGHTIEEIEL